MDFKMHKPFLSILCVFFSAIIISGSATFCGGIFAAVQEKPEPARAMWVWDVKIFQDEEATGRLLNFCRGKNINTLFYTAYKVIGNLQADYRSFNRQAHGRGISVHALAGDPRWAVEKYHHRFLEWVSEILQFNSTAAADERFDAIHSDVEPYLMGKMWEQDHQALLVQYINMNEKGRGFISQAGHKIIFAADVPFWYDDDTTMWVEWKQKVSPANYHILDIVDQIAIMDYRNFAEGENGSILLAKNEILYADRIGKKVYIGQETTKNLNPEYITFGGTSIDYMEQEIRKLVRIYINNPSFAGIAMHHYVSYKRLLRESGMADK